MVDRLLGEHHIDGQFPIIRDLPDGLPLAVPVAEAAEALRAWGRPDDGNADFAGRLRGIGRPFALTSLTVSEEQLRDLAEAAGPLWQAIPAVELMQAPRRPSRRTTDVATFSDGEAVVSGLDRDTARLFARLPEWAYGVGAQVTVTVERQAIPPLPALRNDFAFDRGWRAGGFDTQAPKRPGPVKVQWPSSWAVLRAAVEPHGLTVRPSIAGSASSALMRRLGGFEQLDLLRDPEILGRLDELARRRGISWFRNEVRRLAARADAGEDSGARARIEEHLEQLTLTGADDEPTLITVSALSGLMGARGARAWVEWAERRGLLVRGIEFRCEGCGAKSWRTMTEIGPPVVCGGCGMEVRRPFPADTLQFRYRASQSLLEVMGADALPHLLCAGWFVALMRDGLIGVHPGVEFLDENRAVIAEADVVVLLADGQVGLVECKRRAAGLKQADLDKLERLADTVGAMFTCYATPQWADECSGLWTTLRKDLPDRRRFALYGEHLLTGSANVLSLMGVDVTDPSTGLCSTPALVREDFLRVVDHTLLRNERPERLEDHVLARDA